MVTLRQAQDGERRKASPRRLVEPLVIGIWLSQLVGMSIRLLNLYTFRESYADYAGSGQNSSIS